jgi:hypothetical protein
MAKNILAVAIGEADLTLAITASQPPNFVRTYINGLIAGLSNNGKTIGAAADYTIDYRECPARVIDTYALNKLAAADVVFCMSERVMRIIWQFMHPHPIPVPRPPVKPIVGVISDHTFFNTKADVYGYSAHRSQTALACYSAFRATVPLLQSVYLLVDTGHRPSNAAEAQLHGAQIAGTIDVSEAKVPIGGITTAMTDYFRVNGMPANSGILVLPIDRCFGAADAINLWGYNYKVPIFWPVTDRVYSTTTPIQPSALGGYGVAQEHCGEVMGGQVAQVLWPPAPSQQFVEAVTYSPTNTTFTDITWTASQAAATAAGVSLVNPVPRGLTVLYPP